MLRKIEGFKQNDFEWLDIHNPAGEELREIAARYQLHEELVRDCLQPDHLPKFERMDNYAFIIFRIYAQEERADADTIREMTHKVAIFFSEKFMITIHNREFDFLDRFVGTIPAITCNKSAELLNMLINECLNTYEEPLVKLSRSVDYYEEVIFLRNKKAPLLRGLYYLKRKIDLIKRMLILSYDIIDAVDYEESNVATRDTRDHYVKLQSLFDALSENVHQLLAIYFSAASQRTSEIMRILTIFSVFFMPLTFIVGIYGMNFDFMPELRSRVGYPAVLLLMLSVVVVIYFWFKRKRWL